MAVSISLAITQNSQSIANNTSNVTVKVTAKWTNGSNNRVVAADGTAQAKGWLKIDGTSYNFDSTFNDNKTTSGSKVVFTKTVDVKHNTDGKKTLACSASYTTGVSSGTVTAESEKELTTIPRKSTLSVSNGTLGTAQTLTVTRQSTSFTHSIKAVCGSSTVYIKADGTTQSSEVKHSDCSISFKPPLSWANQNTTGTSVTVKYTITTYNGSTSVGSNTYSTTCSIPASVKPSCMISVTDPMGWATKDGINSYIKGVSRFRVTVTATKSHGSDIDSYNVSANGVTYKTASFTTDAISSSGTLRITATVKDKRGRTGSNYVDIPVIDYSPPTISSLTVHRCDQNGVNNDQGGWIKVSFSSRVVNVKDANLPKYTLEYKPTSGSEYEEPIELDCYGAYELNAYEHVFEADTGLSYDIRVSVNDAISPIVSATTSASTAHTIMHWHATGRGIGFGKVAEITPEDSFSGNGVADFALDAKFNEPVYGKALGMDRLPAILEDADFNDYMDPGCYAAQSNAIAETCFNCPADRAGRLEVWSATGEGVRPEQWSYLRQRYIPYNSANAVWEREVSRGEDNIWHYGDWWRSTLTPSASEKVYSKAARTVCLSANTVLGATNTYTKLPFNTTVLSTNDRLTLVDSSVRIGSNIQYVKVSGQMLLSPSGTNGLRHVRIQKVSGGTTTSIAWVTIYAEASQHTLFYLAPLIVSVKEGDMLHMVFYTGNPEDSISSGSSANGRQTYLTVEEL